MCTSITRPWVLFKLVPTHLHKLHFGHSSFDDGALLPTHTEMHTSPKILTVFHDWVSTEWVPSHLALAKVISRKLDEYRIRIHRDVNIISWEFDACFVFMLANSELGILEGGWRRVFVPVGCPVASSRRVSSFSFNWVGFDMGF